MNTPAHLAASALVWRNETTWPAAAAIALGAFLPDLPMFGFYFYERWFQGHTEKQLWTELYFDPQWQLFFDIFNSIPLMALVMAICYFFGFRIAFLVAASAMLHLLCDFPLHNDDAHRHFLPLTHWRFQSPISYWDPKHFGVYVAILELIFALGASIFVAIYAEALPLRVVGYSTLVLYAAGLAFAVIFWMRFS